MIDVRCPKSEVRLPTTDDRLPITVRAVYGDLVRVPDRDSRTLVE